MHFLEILTFCVAFAMLDIADAIPQTRNGNTGQGQNQNGNTGTGNTGNTGNTGSTAGSATTLDTANIQAASSSDGNPDQAIGQAASLKDNANFINFCSGKPTTNGLQTVTGSCNGIVMGDIPSKNNMISSIIVNPAPGQNINADTTFQIQVQTTNLVAGTFTNPDNTYYAAPQQLQGGKIVGHTHVTVQDLGNSLTPNNPPDPATFAFFLGINDNGNGNGLLSATVNGGLPAGNYRVCTMTSASNHQPVLMPVAQRGAQDDCTKFTVGGNGGNNNQNAAGNQQGNSNQVTGNQAGANQAGANNQVGTNSQATGNQATRTNQASASTQANGNQRTSGTQAGARNQATSTASTTSTALTTSTTSAARTVSTASNQNGNQNQNQGGGFNRGGRRHRFSARDFIM